VGGNAPKVAYKLVNPQTNPIQKKLPPREHVGGKRLFSQQAILVIAYHYNLSDLL
jgi:hypothetical protein